MPTAETTSPSAHLAGDDLALELGRAKALRGGAPRQDQLHALEVRVARDVGGPARQPPIHHVARVAAHDDEFHAEALRQPFAYRQAVPPLHATEVRMDQEAPALVSDVVEVCAHPIGQRLRVTPSAHAHEHRCACSQDIRDLGRHLDREPFDVRRQAEEVRRARRGGFVVAVDPDDVHALRLRGTSSCSRGTATRPMPGARARRRHPRSSSATVDPASERSGPCHQAHAGHMNLRRLQDLARPLPRATTEWQTCRASCWRSSLVQPSTRAVNGWTWSPRCPAPWR